MSEKYLGDNIYLTLLFKNEGLCTKIESHQQ